MIENMIKSERERREEALAAFGGEVEPGAREVTGRELKQMVSVRIEPDLIAALRVVADSRGVKVSDLLREAAAKLVEDYRTPTVEIRSFSISQSAQIKPIIHVSRGSSNGVHGEAAFSSGYLTS